MVKDKIIKTTVEKLRKMSIDSLNKLIDVIDEDKLSDSDKIEFFDTYSEDIIEMLQRKINEVSNIGRSTKKCKTKMKVYVRLLMSMKDGVWYREKDFMNKLSPYLTLEEKRDELRRNSVKYFWFMKGHKALSSMIYYCFKKGYIERRKRTNRNYEYRRKISLKDLETKK